MSAVFGHQPVTPRVQDNSTLPERILDRIFKKRVIVNCDHDPYLHRWTVFKTKWVTLFIHKFVRSDEDRALHDHPWNFLVIPIWRGYYEHSDVRIPRLGKLSPQDDAVHPRRRRVRPIFGARFRRGTYRHRVELIRTGVVMSFTGSVSPIEKPAWSLFFHFKRWREWGFWQPDFIHWQKWWSDKCE